MSILTTAARTVGKAVLDLDAALEDGPDPRQLRSVADRLSDAAGLLRQAAQDIELGIES